MFVSISRLLTEVPCLHRGSRAGLPVVGAPFPIVIMIFFFFFFWAPSAPLHPPSRLSLPLHAAPSLAPSLLSFFLVSGCIVPRLPFPRTICTLIPPLRTTAAHVFAAQWFPVLFVSWWAFLPRPPCLSFGVLSCGVAIHCLSFGVLSCGVAIHRYHTAMATPPLRLQQPAPKPSVFPSDSGSQRSFTYLCEFPESSTLISLIFVAKSEFSRVLAHPTTRNATKTSPTPRPTAQTVWERVPSPCGPS
jgi:hypothetical protein